MNIAFGRTVKSIRDFDLAQTIATQFKRIEREDYIAFLWAVFFGLLAHGMALVSFFVNEDGHGHRCIINNSAWKLGRWMIPVIRGIHENFPFQFPMVLLLIVFVSIGGIIIATLLKTRTLSGKIIIAALLVTYPAFAVVMSYHIIIFSHTVACFLAVFSVFLATKGRLHCITGAILLSLSLAIYQGYLSVSIALCVGILLQIVLKTDLQNRPQVLSLIQKASSFFIYLFLGNCFYVISIKLSKYYYGGEFHSYKGANQIGSISLHAARNTLSAFMDFFNGHYMQIHPYLLFSILGLLALATICTVAHILLRHPFAPYTWIKLGIVAALAILLIPATFIFPIVAPAATVSQMQTYGIIILLSIAVALLSEYRGMIKSITICLSVLILLGFINRANALHYQSYLYTQATFLTANRVLARIETLPEFSKNSKIAILGKLPNEIYQRTNTPPFNEKSQGWFGGPVGFQEVNRPDKFTNIVGYMDYKLRPANAEENQKAKSLATDMPIFPRPGSIKAFGNLVIVKLNYLPPELKMVQQSKSTYKFTAILKEPLDNVKFAWYVQKKTPNGYRKIDTIWYKPSNTLCYTFEDSGTYRIDVFCKNDGTQLVKSSAPIEIK